MENTAYRAIAIVGAGAVLPDAPNVAAFWQNIQSGRYSISEVPAERWDPALYYDPDPSAPDKTYSKIGGWVREYAWDPLKWHMPIPPRVAAAMDLSQQWAIGCTREALEDYGYPKRPLNLDRTAVILGNAMAGEKHYLTVMRVYFPEYARELDESPSFTALPETVRRQITNELHQRMNQRLPEITEDSMPGELANCLAGRIANLYNFHGPNFTTDAACASAMAAISAAVHGLIENDFDVALTGGIDRNMGPSTFVKFCKIGALSATGSRPFADGADGFVMGEGAVILILKRLADAERDGDKIYAVLRGIAGSSDGKGKGITAPNPIGQKLAVERAWQNAGLSPAAATMMEAHGTSTRVGDAVEFQTMMDVLCGLSLPTGSVALGSVKSNIGHLKSAAGAAGLLKSALALRDKVLPPSLNCEHPNPNIDFEHAPLFVNTELKPWEIPGGAVRCAGLSAFGFGGTNFHAVLEEHIPHRLTGNGKRTVAVHASSPANTETSMKATDPVSPQASCKTPLRGALVLGAESQALLAERLRSIQKDAEAGRAPKPDAPLAADLRAPERISIDYGDAAELADKCAKAAKAITVDQPAMWKALRAQGIFSGRGPAPKTAFLYTGQGSQYVNMLKTLRAAEPVIAETFAEADRIMTPLLGKPLSEYIFVDQADEKAVAQAEEDLRQTAITQPAVIASDIALTRLLAAYGIQPDMAMGHSVGEYGALVASGALPFEDAMEAVSARGREMTRVSMADNGKMLAVFAPLPEIDRILKTIDGYVVTANINSVSQAVIGGTTQAVEQAQQAFQKAGYNAVMLQVSHAFHTSIVAPASEPLRRMLERLRLQAPSIPIITNVTGGFYPSGADSVSQMLELLSKQVASPVQFVKGLQTLYDAGARVFVELGPKKALQGFAEDVLGGRGDVMALFTNHPKVGDIPSFNQALCGLYAAGLGEGRTERIAAVSSVSPVVKASEPGGLEGELVKTPTPPTAAKDGQMWGTTERYTELGRMFADVLDRGWKLTHGRSPVVSDAEPVVITGASLGLPGTERVFDDGNIARMLRGEQFIDVIPTRFRRAMVEKHITRVVKNDSGGAFAEIDNTADVIKLAGRAGALDLEKEFGVSAERVPALDRVTRLAIGAGIDALRDAGIPLVLHYKTTSKGTQLPDRWGLPESLRDDTGVIFASAFPGLNALVDELNRYHEDHARRQQLATLEGLRARAENNGQNAVVQEIDRAIEELRATIKNEPYLFDRRFLFKVLPMGHSQFAEIIGARGPNTQLNAACASTTQGVALAEDWIRTGRCRRVIVITADDVTSDSLMDWMGAGFLASGAAATDESVENAALPFDRRRHGMILGMGAAALVVESAEAARERGLQPICEVLSTVTANSAFHGTRLDVQHIGGVMESLVSQAERRSGISRQQIAPQTVFVSHETYTPARGGSASAEINALRRVFAEVADKVVIANTKGFTGHAMAAGIEDVVAVKVLETGCVPPVANFKEIDPELGALNLSKGGAYPVEYALRLGAGFGSQICMMLLRWVKTKDAVRRAPSALGYSYRIADNNVWNAWLNDVAGQPKAELEVVQRTLRVRDQKAAVRVAETPQEAQPKAAAPVAAPPPPVQAMAAKAGSAGTAAAVVTVAAPPPPAPKPAAKGDPVKDRVLALVAEKTGYPIDMLDLDLDLEADLGVDTVKQAEVFATIREAYGIQRDDSIRLRDFPTLTHVIRFVYDRRPDLASAAQTTAATPLQDEGDVPTLRCAQDGAPIYRTASQVDDPVKERILALVVEKTGYPKDMLDLDLDLEADLGVDTVKQAELLAAIREVYGIPRDENLKLRDFPTLKHVIQFVYDRCPNLIAPKSTPVQETVPAHEEAKEQTKASAEVTASVQRASSDPVEARLLDLVVEKTGYPREMLDLDLDLEADLGVDTVKQAELFAAIRESYNIPRDENLRLRDFPTLAHVIRFVYDKRPDLAAAPTEVPAQQESQPTAADAVPASSQSESDDPVKERLLNLVVEKTGYPKEMLDLDLDLEADLGVDTVKQAELFAAIRQSYDIPRDENLKLRDFPTLAHVIRFVHERRPDLAQTVAPEVAEQQQASVTAPSPAAAARSEPVLASLDAANQIPRRVPVPVLRPPLSLCKSTGVTLGAGSRVIVMPDSCGVAASLAQQLQDKGVEVLRIENTPSAEVLTTTLKSWIEAGPISGVYWLPALDIQRGINEMDLGAWRETLRVCLKSLYHTMRTLYEQVAAPGTFLVSATRLGGQHGYDAAGAVAPIGGAVVGFTKTYKRERTDTLVKAVDFESNREPSKIAELLIDETLRDPGAVEIGYKDAQRWSVALQEQPASHGQPGLELNKDTVFLITGAAGGIVSAITADLASASGGTFYLLDLVPEPDPQDPDLKRFATDKEELKLDLMTRKSDDKRPTPAQVEKQLAALERAQAALNAIEAVRAAGGTPYYISVNLTDADAVENVIAQVRERSGRIDVLLHAAGMERSHFLPDKDPREFDLVFDVKSDGWFNLLHSIGAMPLGATVAFSSIAGRFGNGGQADYSSANDLLCKITSSFRTVRPSTRAIAIDWTAWGGIGMATRGSIPKMMELAGIDMLPPEAGIPTIRRELTMGGTRGEVLIGQRLGILMQEWEASGGLDTKALQTAQTNPSAQGPMAGKIAAMGVHSGLTIETTLDPKVQPFLHDHQIEGTPVLPGVMGVEAFAEAALRILPGWNIEAVEDVNFVAPFKFYRNEPRTITVRTVFRPDGDALIAECRLTGSRQLPNQTEPQVTTHFTARVRLTQHAPEALRATAPGEAVTAVIEAKDIYRAYFHGPAYKVMEKAWRDGDRIVGLMAVNLPSNHEPSELPLAMSPRLIELCFQTAGLWEMGTQGRMGLPMHIDSVHLLRAPDTAEGRLHAVVTPTADSQRFDAEVVDSAGNAYVQLRGYCTVALPTSVASDSLKALQAVA